MAAQAGGVQKTLDGTEHISKDIGLEQALFLQSEHRNWVFTTGSGRWGLRVNPVSFLASVALILGFAVWLIVLKEEAKDNLAKSTAWVTRTMTWIYMVTQQAWVILLAVIYVSPMGSIKMGKPHDKPEFPTISWFMMIFSAGVGIGLFFWGVAEPITHYEPCYPGNPDTLNETAGVGSTCHANRYANLQDDERAQWAMNLSILHWGIHGWVTYVIVGMTLGVVVYRKDLPMTMKSAFYPLIGDKVFGWMGDAIDAVSVVTTMFGITTSLGLGVRQISAGLSRLNSAIPNNATTQIVIIWCITLTATISVVTGMRVGIRRLSEINWVLALFIAVICFLQENTWYILNNMVQSAGVYVQWIIQLGLWCDTFAQAPIAHVTLSNGVIERVSAAAPDGTSANRDWMDDWTFFYWGWWIAWAPFVGMFIAKISRGRTVRELIAGALAGPVVYCFCWFCLFGGIALRIERQAASLGITCPQPGSGELPMIEDLETKRQWWRLSCRNDSEMWFDMLSNFPLHGFYWAISLASLVLYFVTSSDSASLVIDCLTSNGNPEPPVLQRVFWSCTEGIVATALLRQGGEDALLGLRAISILAGVPYTVVLCVMCKALWVELSNELAKERGQVVATGNRWHVDLLDVLDYPTFSSRQLLVTVGSIFAPWYFGGYGAAWVTGVSQFAYYTIYGLGFNSWPLLLLLNLTQDGLWALAWAIYLGFAMHLGFMRSEMRRLRGIMGDVLSDMALGVLAYPFVAAQLYAEARAAEGSDEVMQHSKPAWETKSGAADPSNQAVSMSSLGMSREWWGPQQQPQQLLPPGGAGVDNSASAFAYQQSDNVMQPPQYVHLQGPDGMYYLAPAMQARPLAGNDAAQAAMSPPPGAYRPTPLQQLPLASALPGGTALSAQPVTEGRLKGMASRKDSDPGFSESQFQPPCALFDSGTGFSASQSQQPSVLFEAGAGDPSKGAYLQ